MTLTLPPETEARRQKYRSSVLNHTKFVHGVTLFPHQREWAEALEDMSIKRLLIIAAPKFGKTPTVGLDYLGWRIGNDWENYHCIYVSKTQGMASKPTVALRDTIHHSVEYQWLYETDGGRPAPDTSKGWSEHEWFLKRQNLADKDPTLQCCGVYGAILGATVQEVIFDDIADLENMATEYQRQKVMEWVKDVAMPRLVPGDSRAIMICTRWHEDDPAGIFEKEGWHVVHLPAINEAGESNHPTYWTMEALEERRVDLGVRGFELEFQGRVLPAEGVIFKREWWRYWTNEGEGQVPWLKHPSDAAFQPIVAIVQSWDTAHKGKVQNDYSACETWAVCAGGYYLLNAWRGKMDYPQVKVAFQQLNDQFHPQVVLVEDAASGIDLVLEMKLTTTIPVFPITVKKDKKARAEAATPVIESGNVLIPREATWLADWMYEHEVFPGGRNDDWVDTTTQFINWARGRFQTQRGTLTSIPKTSTWRQ